MIKGRGKVVRSAARALVHQNDIHPRSHALVGDPQHVMRVRGSLQPVDHDDGDRRAAVRLPKAVAQNANPILDGDEPLLRLREIEFPLEKETRNGLDVSAAQKAPWTEFNYFRGDILRCESSHSVILNKSGYGFVLLVPTARREWLTRRCPQVQ